MFRLCCVIICFVAGLSPALAQTNNNGTGAERAVMAYRLAEGETVTVDGQLDEAFWSRVPVATDFRQVDPIENADPAQPTRVRIAYDSQNLYVGWEVDEIGQETTTRAIRRRDGPVYQDDHVRIALDPHRTGRNTYNFAVNANGARQDILFENNITIRGAWDAIWQAAAAHHEDGWTAEMVIPFSNLSYPGAGEDWGVDFARVIRRDYDANRWAQHDQTLGMLDASGMGRLSGLEGIDTGSRLEVEAFASTRFTHIWPEPGREDDLIGRLSGNAYYKITDGLTGTLTVNTDFSDAPLDSRIVSTSRFATFFGETRDFFLQDSAIFEFGGRGFNDEDTNGLPFFSRNIGLVEGQIIDLMAGGKISGRTMGNDVGALVTLMDDGRDFESQVLGVGRISRPVLDGSKVGAMFVAGDPTGATENYVGGLDFQYRSPFANGTATADLYILDSYTADASGLDPTNDLGHGQAWGGALRYRGDEWEAQLITKHLEEDYNPALGFLNRPESRLYQTKLGHFWYLNNETFRVLEMWNLNEVVTDLGSTVQSRVHGGSFEGSFSSSDYFGTFVEWQYDRVTEAFTLPGDVEVPTGEYDGVQIGWWIGGADSRVVSPHFEGACCSLFGGDYLRLEGNVEWRPHPVFSLEWNNAIQFIDLPTGSVDIYVTSLSANISFTPDMQLITDVQYDNISGNMNIFSRYRWEFAPGAELFVGLGHNADVPARDFANEFSSNVTTMTVRVGKTFSY